MQNYNNNNNNVLYLWHPSLFCFFLKEHSAPGPCIRLWANPVLVPRQPDVLYLEVCKFHYRHQCDINNLQTVIQYRLLQTSNQEEKVEAPQLWSPTKTQRGKKITQKAFFPPVCKILQLQSPSAAITPVCFSHLMNSVPRVQMSFKSPLHRGKSELNMKLANNQKTLLLCKVRSS